MWPAFRPFVPAYVVVVYVIGGLVAPFVLAVIVGATAAAGAGPGTVYAEKLALVGICVVAALWLWLIGILRLCRRVIDPLALSVAALLSLSTLLLLLVLPLR